MTRGTPTLVLSAKLYKDPPSGVPPVALDLEDEDPEEERIRAISEMLEVAFRPFRDLGRIFSI